MQLGQVGGDGRVARTHSGEGGSGEKGREKREARVPEPHMIRVMQPADVLRQVWKET